MSGLHHELIVTSRQCHTSVVVADNGATGWTGVTDAEEDTMSYPTVEIGKKKIILLSGFERASGAKRTLAVTAKDQLEEAAKRHHDAVAFGYVSGMWMPAA